MRVTGTYADALAFETESGMPAASDIRWVIDAAPWLAARRLIDIAIEALSVVADDLAADVIMALALTVADLNEEMNAVRAVQRVAFGHLHQQHRELLRLRRRLADLLDERHANRVGDV